MQEPFPIPDGRVERVGRADPGSVSFANHSETGADLAALAAASDG